MPPQRPTSVLAGVAEFHRRAEMISTRLKNERVRAIFGLAISLLEPASIDKEMLAFESLPDDAKAKDPLRVADLPRFLETAASQAAALKWDRSPTGAVLSVGRATTYLAFCAKALGGEVTVAYPENAAHDRLVEFLGLNRFVQKRRTDLPDGSFQTILSGNLAYASQPDWVAFIKPLAEKLSNDGEIDLFITKRALPEKNFDPAAAFEMFERSGITTVRDDALVRLSKQQAQIFVAAASAKAKPSGAPAEAKIVPPRAEPISRPEPAAPPSKVDPVAESRRKRSRARTIVIVLGVLAATGVAAAILALTH